ncbi:hypothetical protein BH10BAC3_BH10BAC3_08120 [soil metagenome]
MKLRLVFIKKVSGSISQEIVKYNLDVSGFLNLMGF